MRAGPDHRTNQHNAGPQAAHEAPVEKARQRGAARSAASLAAHGGSLFALTRRLLVVGLLLLAPGRSLFRLGCGRGDAVFRTQPDRSKGGAEPELRLLAYAALFSSPRHTLFTPTKLPLGTLPV